MITVAGCASSGTTLVARMLEKLGVNMNAETDNGEPPWVVERMFLFNELLTTDPERARRDIGSWWADYCTRRRLEAQGRPWGVKHPHLARVLHRAGYPDVWDVARPVCAIKVIRPWKETVESARRRWGRSMNQKWGPGSVERDLKQQTEEWNRVLEVCDKRMRIDLHFIARDPQEAAKRIAEFVPGLDVGVHAHRAAAEIVDRERILGDGVWSSPPN